MSNSLSENQKFNEFFDCIYPIFKDNQLKPLSDITLEGRPAYDYIDRIQWFNQILREFVKFGVSLNIQTNKHKKSRSSSAFSSKTSIKLFDEISLSKYIVLDVYNLYTIQFINQYPKVEYWSHQMVLPLLEYIENGKIKSMFVNDINPDKEVWLSIKRFVNMIYGVVNAHMCDLAIIDDEFCVNTFRNNATENLMSMLPRQNIVCLDTDRVLLNCSLKDFNLRFDDNRWSLYNVVGCSDNRSGLKELNKICRKHSIDIIY